MKRVQDQDPSVYDPNQGRTHGRSPLADDADYSVDHGSFVSQRADLLSELDVIWKDKFGVHASVARVGTTLPMTATAMRRKAGQPRASPMPTLPGVR